MSTEDNKAVVRRVIEEGINQRNLAVFDELCATDCVFHNSSLTLQGLEAVKQFLSMYFMAFPDIHFTIEGMMAEGDKVAFRGTHKGVLMGIPPTGKQVNVTGIDIFCVAGGKIVEQWTNADDLGAMQQLGVVPALR